MKKLMLIVLLIPLPFLSFGQDLIYTVSGKVDGSNVSLDSILFENLSNRERLLFGALPEQKDYVINLSSGEQQGSTGILNLKFENSFRIAENTPGRLRIACLRSPAGEVKLSVFNIQGQKLYSSPFATIKSGSNIDIHLGTPGIYLVRIESASGMITFKGIGQGKDQQFGMDIREPAGSSRDNLKGSMDLTQQDFSFLPGDSLRVSVYKDGYYTRPKVFVITASGKLAFIFETSTVDSTGISDVYASAVQDDEITSFNDSTGEVRMTAGIDSVEVREGDILTIDADTTGYLRKIVEVTDSSGNLTLKTEPAYLNEVFVNSDIKLDTKFQEPEGGTLKSTSSVQQIISSLTDDKGYIHPVKIIYYDRKGNQIKKSAFATEDVNESSVSILDFYQDFSGTDLYGTAGDNVHFYVDEGHVSLASDAIFEFDFKYEGELDENTKVKKGDLKRFKFYLDTKAGFQTKLALDMSRSFEKDNTKTLVDFKKVTAKFMVPPGVPVWITFDCDVMGAYHLQADASLHADWGFESNHSLKVGGEYVRADNSFTPIKEYTPQNTIYPLNLSGEVNASARFEIYPRIEVMFYSIFGPYAEIVPYVAGNYNAVLQSQITPSGSETFTAWNSGIDLGMDFRVGTKLSFLGLLNKEFGPETINCFEDPLWASPADIELVSDLPPQADPGSTISLTYKVTDMLGAAVPLCPVYISGDGEFSREIPLTNIQGEVSVDWTVGNETGDRHVSAKICKADHSVVKEVTSILSFSGVSPVAAFVATPTTVAEGQSIQFTDQSANAPSSWSWDFGDGGSSSQQNPSHTYHAAGTYTVSLTVTNGFGSDTETKTDFIKVNPENTQPNDIVFNPDLTYGTVTDIDGNTYKTIQIGAQVWMAQNLATTHYNDGTVIPLVTDNSAWESLSTPAYCWYDNDKVSYENTYGALYNWYVVETDKLCPTGWHVPSDAEWTILTDYLGGKGAGGGKLKETGTTHWITPNTGATNESGFSALPGGFRDSIGSFGSIGYVGNWWSATEYNPVNAWYRYVYFNVSDVYSYDLRPEVGFSVRCVRD